MNLKIAIGIIGFSVLFTNAIAQKVNLESAITAYRNNDELSIKDAVMYIDKAVEHEETKMKPKAWYYRGAIYNRIAGDEKLIKLDSNAGEKALNSLLKCMELDKKNEFNNDDMYDAEGNSTSSLQYLYVATFNALSLASNKYNAGNYPGALAIYEQILKVYPYDKKGVLKQNNLSRLSVWEYTAYTAKLVNNVSRSKELYNWLIDSNYNQKSVYISLYNIYIDEHDTTNAMRVLNRAKLVFNEDPNFRNLELNLYLASGNTAELIKNLTKSIEQEPDKGIYYLYRGNTNEQIVNGMIKQKGSQKSIDSTYLLIESDYKKALEIEPNDTFANYSLGAFYFNQAVLINNKINDLDAKKPNPALKKELEANRKAQLAKALPYLEKAYELKNNEREMAQALQQCYYMLEMSAKALEMKNKIKNME